MESKMTVDGLVKTFTLSHMSVKHIAIKDETTIAAYTANMFIPIIDVENGKILKRHEMANQVAGLHYSLLRPDFLYAVDDSFGLHVFDSRLDTKRKHRMNPEVERHTVTCTAMAGNLLAVASSTFGAEILDVRSSRKGERFDHVITLFDVRNPNEPLTTYKKNHKSDIISMEFFKNEKDLLVCEKNGRVTIYDSEKRDEDNARRWDRFIRGPPVTVGLINKRIAYAIGNGGEVNVIINSRGKIDILFGNISKTEISENSKTTSPATFAPPKKLFALLKGVTDDLPLVAVWTQENDSKICYTAMDQHGSREAKNMLSYDGHEGEIKCFAVDKNRLVTGGEDGKMIIRTIDFKAEGFDKIQFPLKLSNTSSKLRELDDSEDGQEPSTSSASNPSSSSKKRRNADEKKGNKKPKLGGDQKSNNEKGKKAKK